MMARSVFLVFLSVRACQAHYGPPGQCESDEVMVAIFRRFFVCAPRCYDDGTCPDAPTGVSGDPQCAIQGPFGHKYCLLECKSDDDCDTSGGATCYREGSTGVCHYYGANVSQAAAPTVRLDLRSDGAPVVLMPPGVLEAEFSMQLGGAPRFPFKPFSSDYVKKALSTPVDWMTWGAVTPAKDQGAHGYCGTFGRVAAAEGQYALRSGFGLRNFSEEELVDCIGWDKDQFSYFSQKGFMDSNEYPYNKTGPDMDPPIPYNPCRLAAESVIKRTANGKFTNATGLAPSEEQLAAFIFKNGPVQTGINANVFGLRKKGCEAKGDCFITQDMCTDPKIKDKPIDHSVTLTGYGTDPDHGPYWIVKNSWSTKFANNGFIKVARGISCARVDCCGNVFTYGDPQDYYEPEVVDVHGKNVLV